MIWPILVGLAFMAYLAYEFIELDRIPEKDVTKHHANVLTLKIAGTVIVFALVNDYLFKWGETVLLLFIGAGLLLGVVGIFYISTLQEPAPPPAPAPPPQTNTEEEIAELFKKNK